MSRAPFFVSELAAGIADRNPIDWEAARRKLGSGAGASWLEHLDLLARVAESVDRERPAAPVHAGHRLGVPTASLLLLIALQLALAAVAILTRPEAGPGPFQAFWSALAGTSYCLVGAYLILGGHRDPRARDLGLCFATVASAFAGRFLSRYDAGGVTLLGHLHPDAFAPFFLWRFTCRFPHTRWYSPFDATARAMTSAAFAVGLLLFLANGFLPLASGTALGGVLRTMDRHSHGIMYWGAVALLALPMLVVLPGRARHAPTDERRRLRLFVGGLLVAFGPMLLEITAEVISPAWEDWALRPETLAVVGPLQLAFLSLGPVTTAYSVLSDRVLDARVVVRRTAGFLLARTTLAVVTLFPAMLLLVELHGLRHLPLGEAFTSARVLRPAVWLSSGLLALVFAPRLGRWLERAFFRDVPDPAVLISLSVDAVGRARSAEEALQNLTSCLREQWRLRGARAMAVDASGALQPLSAGIAPLPAGSAFDMLLEGRDPVPVEPDRPGSVFAWLPAGEQAWVLAANASLLLPLADARGNLRGLIVLGEKRSQEPFTAEDARQLHSAGRAAGAVLGQHAATVAPADQASLDAPAQACAACGSVFAAEARVCRCGTPTEPTVVPELLAGRVRIVRLLGRGGMGVVFEGRDEELERGVAVKTLPQVSPASCQGLRREARAMARVSHAGLATLYGVESWRHTPVLLVELLEGGTLADRLRLGGSLAWPAALDMGIRLTDALGALHKAGLLHRDVKPSNIGFKGDGTPKLLDFGLAELVESFAGVSATDRLLAGTLAYLPPEAFRGEPQGPAFDLWALALTIFEAGAGHPFRQGLERAATQEDALRAFTAVSLPGATPPGGVALFEAALAVDPARRPRSAAELRSLLEGA